MTTIMRNPVPAALAAIGLGLLWTNRATESQGSHRSSYARYGRDQSGMSAEWSSGSSTVGSPGGGQPISEQVMGQAQQMGGQVQEVAGLVVGQVQERAAQMQDQMHERAGQMQHQAQGVWQMLETNPVVVAALGSVLGGVAALLIPETEKENQLLGETRDRVVSSVQEMAGDAVAKVQIAAEEAGSAAIEAGQAAMDELNAPPQGRGETGKSATGKRDSGSGTST